MAVIFNGIIHCLWISFIPLDATQFVYNTDFTASCYSRIGGFSGAQIDYTSNILSTTLFDRLAIAGDITINGNDYFFLQIDFMEPIDLHSAQLIWRPINARAATTDQSSMTFTQISYYNLFTDSYNLLNISQSQWDPIVADYVLFKADISSIDLLFTNSIIFQLSFQNSSISGIHLTLANIAGAYYTWSPTNSPTSFPTESPTFIPTLSPSSKPTKTPTKSPTINPTKHPTQSPTFYLYDHATDRNNNMSSVQYSSNIYPLSDRNQTLLTFTVPGDKPYCLTCILAWADIDASIELSGCNDVIPSADIIPNPFYNCADGIWTLKTSARLADWQQTYGRIEIWEIDANELEYLQLNFEFQWNSSQCKWRNAEDCDYLPLTNTNENTAMFEFTMPKNYGDNRNAPLIVVWYDLLSIPYAVRPSIYYQYENLTLMDVGKGREFGISDLWTNFKTIIIASAVFVASFVCISIIACMVAGEKTNREQFMLKTYNLRTAYKQSVDNEILPKEYAQNKSKFVCKRHGPWLLVVFIARLVYMAVFTLSFFFLVFKSINAQWFDVLSTYDAFASNRDVALKNVSANIEEYYLNETERMEEEIEYRQKYCYTQYINDTNIAWNEGALAQYNNHSLQMHEKIQRAHMDLDTLNQTDTIYITGNTACDVNTENGARIFESDPLRKVFVFQNGTYKNTTFWKANEYDRDWDNFTEIEQLLINQCMKQSWCEGWSWIDPDINGTDSAQFYLLSSLSDPVNSAEPGLCYTVSRFDESAFDFGSIESLENRTDILRDKYLNDYQYQVETMGESLNGIWNALQSLGDDADEDADATYQVIVNNDPAAEGYDIDIQLNEMLFSTSSSGNTQWRSSWYVIVTCPGCPDGTNFTSPQLQQLQNYLFGVNSSNISDYMNGTHGALPVNISNLVSINPAIIEYPNLPSIDFPIKFDIPIDWTMIVGIGAALDMILLIYRWYRTIGILARIIKGKDVEIALRYLKVKNEDQKCCKGRKCADKLLSSIMWVHDKCYYLRYNMVKLCYWITVLLNLFVAAALILILYIIADQVLTVDFIHDLGTFNLMTTGISAQRAVRNQVLSTTALSYNNYTINNIEETSSDFAQTKNMESYEWNIEELKRVDEWNAYFCNAYNSYQLTPRDITTDNAEISYNSSWNHVDYIFDDNANTSFYPNYNEDDEPVIIDIELPFIQYTAVKISYWDISQIQIAWNFRVISELDDAPNMALTVKSKLKSSDHWITRYEDEYNGVLFNKINDIKTIYMNLNETRFIRMLFSNASYWNNMRHRFEINEIKIFGSAPLNKIVCDKVQFHLWSFDASDIKSEECPTITPVFGNMYRGFVRDSINNQLLEAHKPFILAIRNIALSPFFILFIGILVLIAVYLLGFMIEWLLIRFDLFRENVFSKVTLITTKWDEYQPNLHYVTTPESSSEEETDVDECGGNYLSPTLILSPQRDTRGTKRKKRAQKYMVSPKQKLVEMEQIVLTSAKKMKGKLKRLTDRISSPNMNENSANARELARMLFNEKQHGQNTDNDIQSMHEEIDSTEDEEIDSYDYNYGDDPAHEDRCKQQ